MSKSFKHNPISKDGGKSSKKNKQIANRSLRRKLNNHKYELANFNGYKKHYESWNINDYISRWTKEEAIQMYNNLPEWRSDLYEQYPTLESWLEHWEKCMVRK